LLITSQHNHKCLPKSKENIVLRGGQFESAGGGQFAPARTDFYSGTGVVNLDRQTLVKVNGLSTLLGFEPMIPLYPNPSLFFTIVEFAIL
jgi:hypothetical protein